MIASARVPSSPEIAVSTQALGSTSLCEPTPPFAAAAVGRARREAGMTLIEILIVLGIIALVMGFLVGPQVIKKLREARLEAAYNMTQNMEKAYGIWEKDNPGGCPTIDQLKDAMGKRKNDKVKDPWGEDYVLKCGDEAPEECAGFCVLSKGPNKKEGDSDDIKSWQPLKK
jgi:prepilin-type N-terminal cleavage/methylation domain-containing protein